MTTSYQPHRRRLLAGLAVVGILPLSTTLNANAQETLPTCEQSALSGERSEFIASLKNEDGRKVSFARVDIKPSKIKQKTIRFAPGITEDDLILFIPRLLVSETQTNEQYRWHEMSANIPTMYYASNDLPIKVISLRITLGGKTKFQAMYNYVVRQAGFGQKFGDIKTQLRISLSGKYSKIAEQVLANWLENASASGNIKIHISDVKNGPDGLVITYKRKDILRAIKQAETALIELENGLAVGKCTLVSSSSDCFMTTAACDVIGLADDCWELQTLRNFRDGWLSDQSGGAADILRYYKSAPDIIQIINKRPGASKVWLKLYWLYILPSAVLVKFGFHKTARTHYAAMMRKMSNVI